MGLYTRKEYEDHLKQIDTQIAKSADLLGKQLIGPQQHWLRCRQLEELKRKLGMKLAMTAISLADKKRMEKGKQFAWVIGAKKVHETEACVKKGFCTCDGAWYVAGKKEPLIKHGSPHYRNTTLREIYELQNQGVTVMESGFMKRGKSQNVKQELEDDGSVLLAWTETTKEQARFMQAAGEFREKNGKQLWYSYYMIRTEGEGANRKFYYADVR